ncbi:MAG TPA: RDD family protein [Halanaerobiales bacterium]|nr:RDD family protein [Halanaerobiales bacterium]
MKKAELSSRVIGALIDGAVGWVLVFIPVIGAILGTLYLLLKEGLMFQITSDKEWQNRSIGKKIMNLEVEGLDNQGALDLAVSAKRNIPLAIPTFIAIIPFIGWGLGAVVGLGIGVIELVFVLTDEEGRRLGDRWAETRVVQTVQSTIQDKEIDTEDNIKS